MRSRKRECWCGPYQSRFDCRGVRSERLRSNRPAAVYWLSSSSLPKVGLCLGGLALRFAFDGVARVGGGAPIFSRAAAFTADAVLNGFGLRGFEGTGRYRLNQGNLTSRKGMPRVRRASLSAHAKPSLLAAARWLALRQRAGLGGGEISV